MITNDEQVLLTKAKKGDSESLAGLCRQYEPLMQKASQQSHLRPIGEDALSEARIAFIEAVYSYDAAKKVPFAGYAKAMVFGKMRTIFKQARRQWQREIYPAAVCDDEGNEVDFWDTVADEHDDYEAVLTSEMLAAYMKKLTPRQRDVLHLLYIEGLTQKEVANKLGISQQAVAKIKKKATDRINDHNVAGADRD